MKTLIVFLIIIVVFLMPSAIGLIINKLEDKSGCMVTIIIATVVLMCVFTVAGAVKSCNNLSHRVTGDYYDAPRK